MIEREIVQEDAHIELEKTLEADLRQNVSPYLSVEAVMRNGTLFIHVFGDEGVTECTIKCGAEWLGKKGYKHILYSGQTTLGENRLVQKIQELEKLQLALQEAEKRERKWQFEQAVARIEQWKRFGYVKETPYGEIILTFYCATDDVVIQNLIQISRDRIERRTGTRIILVNVTSRRDAYPQFRKDLLKKLVKVYLKFEAKEGKIQKMDDSKTEFHRYKISERVELFLNEKNEWNMRDISTNTHMVIEWNDMRKGHNIRSIGKQVEKFGLPRRNKMHISTKQMEAALQEHFLISRLSRNKRFMAQVERWRHSLWAPYAPLARKGYETWKEYVMVNEIDVTVP